MSRQRILPTSRLSRLRQFGGLASNVVGNVLLDGVKELSKGNVPALKELLLSGKNIQHLAERLSRLRGAAMKMGQILSMDGGELLPPELTELLAVLRDAAYTMPDEQLQQTLQQHLGPNWQAQFVEFATEPFAAASIGQVHRGQLLSGEEVAVKVQYPGVADAIHSDVDNMGSLLRASGLLPKSIVLEPILLEIKMQLIREADYQIEARYLRRYQEHLASQERFVLPQVYPQLSNERVLCMQYLPGINIEDCAQLPQEERDQVGQALVSLLFQELFDFRLMQTDPNFANYRYQPDTKKVVLLDFGATQDVPQRLSDYYRQVVEAVLQEDLDSTLDMAIDMGFFVANIPPHLRKILLDTLTIAAEPLQFAGLYDFAASDVLARLREQAQQLMRHPELHGNPPPEVIFIHRKIAGLYLLMIKIKARVNLRQCVSLYL